MIDLPHPDTVHPDEAFQILADDTRIEILSALYEGGGEAGPARLSFSELRNATDIKDSGQFNYHLQQLLDIFVREFEDGYGLTFAGQEAYRAVATGLYQGSTTAESVSLDSDCPACDQPLELSYGNDRFSIECSTCPTRIADVPFSLEAARTHDFASLLDAIDTRLKQRTFPDTFRICTYCGGSLRGTVLLREELPFDPGENRVAFVQSKCQACNATLYSPIGGLLLHRSEIIGFYDQHGRDILSTRAWNIPFVVSDDPISVVEEDPVKLKIELTSNDDILRIFIDEELNIDILETDSNVQDC